MRKHRITIDPGSFRDPSGFVFRKDNRIFRTVTEHAIEQFDYVKASGLYDLLAEKNLALPVKIVDDENFFPENLDICRFLETECLSHISYPYEWSFSQLKAAALCHLDIHLIALDKNVTLSDASAYNIQFRGATPVFIDHLSFVRYEDGEVWRGHRQFCEQFLNPLLLRALLGVTHNSWYRGNQEGITTSDLAVLLRPKHKLRWNVLTHVVLQARLQNAAAGMGDKLEASGVKKASLPLQSFKNILKGLRNWIATLHPAKSGKTVWQDYARTHSYTSDETQEKFSFIAEFSETTKPNVIWDLGCNIGEHSIAALNAGAKYAVGFDFDQGAIDAAFVRAQEQNLPFQTAFLDAANPSPDQGWYQRERRGLGNRTSADGVMALAFIHHLAITRNIPLSDLLDWIMGFAPKGVIEFVPKNDAMVQELLRFREDIFPNYTKEYFLAHIKKTAVIKRQLTVSASGRLLIWYDRTTLD
jgi:ribosomal protein L11 methylase PrmA